MKTKLFAIVLLAALTPALALAGDIGNIRWDQSNIAALRKLDIHYVEEFINGLSPGDVHKTVGEYAWADLAGDGRYELVATLDLSGRAFFDYLAVYQRGDSGKISVQWFPEETAIGKLSSVIRDLDNDGKKELVVPTRFPSGTYGAGSVSAVWPAVYKLRDGSYVEDSNEFANFYDTEVLPRLTKDISELGAKTGNADSPELVSKTMERDKILRELGRDRTAGLAEASEWAKSGDPNVASAGRIVVQSINGELGAKNGEKRLPKVVVLRK